MSNEYGQAIRKIKCKSVIIMLKVKTQNEFPVKSMKLVNYKNEILTGGHHYEGDIDKVSKTIIKNIY